MGELANYVGNIQRKIQRAKTEVPKKAGKRLVEDADQLVQEAMGEWYASYSPTVYHRTFDLMAGVTAGTVTSFSGNVLKLEVSSGAVPDHKHDSGEYIFNGAFMQGIHGTSAIAVTEPPYQIYEPKLKKKCDEVLSEELDKTVSAML